MMKKIVFLIIPTLFIVTNLFSQIKVANYSVGKAGTEKYEHFDFWTKDKKRTEVNYAYGKNRREVKLQYLGKDVIDGDTCFKIQFPNKYTLYIVQKELQLQVVDSSSKYNKTFSWEYEGPVNGIGTYCSICAEDDEGAMKLILSAYLK